jgi:hypothetical protein
MAAHNKRINYDERAEGMDTLGLELQPNEKTGVLAIVALDERMRPKGVVHIPSSALDEVIQSLTYMQEMMGG